MEDIKLFYRLIRREYPDTKFGSSNILGNTKNTMIVVFTDNSECVKFAEQVNSFLGNQFRLKFFSMWEWERFNKKNQTLSLNWFDKMSELPLKFIKWILG